MLYNVLLSTGECVLVKFKGKLDKEYLADCEGTEKLVEKYPVLDTAVVLEDESVVGSRALNAYVAIFEKGTVTCTSASSFGVKLHERLEQGHKLIRILQPKE